MLILAGLGLGDERSLTIEELEEAKKCEKVYLERYTSIWHGSLENLEKMVGKSITVLSRRDLEEEDYKIVEEAREKNVIIFVPGDPLVATTHISILLECLKRNVKFKVIHNASIVSAVCETGLQIYRFGKIVTIPFRWRTSSYDSIKSAINLNRTNNLHTLCLLDIDIEKNLFLRVKEAIDILIENEIIGEDDKIVVASRLGSDERKIVYEKVKNLRNQDFDLPAIIIIPSSLHFTEEHFLSSI